jgi:Holliday junction resolvase RusA-like endonuclease
MILNIPGRQKIDGGYKVMIEDVPPSLNKWSRMHWTKSRKIKKFWEETVQWMFAGIKQFKNPVVRIRYSFDTKRRRDKDNYTPKFIMDGLVKSGVIKDDNVGAVDLDWNVIVPKNADGCATEIMILEKEELPDWSLLKQD